MRFPIHDFDAIEETTVTNGKPDGFLGHLLEVIRRNPARDNNFDV